MLSKKNIPQLQLHVHVHVHVYMYNTYAGIFLGIFEEGEGEISGKAHSKCVLRTRAYSPISQCLLVFV